jgi:hypothetical protein
VVNNLPLEILPHSFFSDKKIQNVYGGRYFYFAVEREEISPFNEWNNN